MPWRQWKKRIADHARSLTASAFILDDVPSFFLPFSLDTKELSAAVGNNKIDDAFTLVSNAIKHIYDNINVFDRMIAQARDESSAR